MSFLITLLLGLTVHADEVQIRKITPVYSQPAFDAAVKFNLRPGEKVTTTDTGSGDYLQIKLKRKGKTGTGYVLRHDLVGDARDEGVVRKNWALGGGAGYISLSQGGKSFETDDQVHYTTSAYKATGISPFLTAQLYDQDFWRLTLALKRLNYTGTAITDVVGSKAQDVDLQYSFFSALLQKAWSPFASKMIYLGLGAEAAKATGVSLKLGNSTLATSSSDMPLYLGGLIFGGVDLSLGRSLSVFAEARYEYIANQTPAIMGLEAALGLLWWP